MPGRVSRAGTPAPSHLLAAAVGLFAARGFYRLVARGALTLDTGIGRTVQPLGPVPFEIAAPTAQIIAGARLDHIDTLHIFPSVDMKEMAMFRLVRRVSGSAVEFCERCGSVCDAACPRGAIVERARMQALAQGWRLS